MSPDKPRPSADLRYAPRYPVEAPVEFSGGIGMTRDLSTTGVYFTCEHPMRVGSRMSFAITIDDTLADMPIRTEYQGTIVRVDQSGGKIGVAVKLDRMKLPTNLH